MPLYVKNICQCFTPCQKRDFPPSWHGLMGWDGMAMAWHPRHLAISSKRDEGIFDATNQRPLASIMHRCTI